MTTKKNNFQFKSKIGIQGFSKETLFLIKDIPAHGNIKVYYKEGLLERFFWMIKNELQLGLESKKFIKL
jgi:hypothetical protein